MRQTAETVCRADSFDVSAPSGCAFPIDAPEDGRADGPAPACGALRRPGSAYCPRHHALCHLALGSGRGRWRLLEFEALAAAAGGRLGGSGRWPGPAALRRIEQRVRVFLRASRSRFVQQETAMPPRKLPPIAAAEASEGPTPERLGRGEVERVGQAIADAAGAPARPYRALDTLAVMQRRGSITAATRQAGEDFRTRFTVAQLDPLRALDLRQLRGVDRSLAAEPGHPGLRIEGARRSVWQAIRAVGGIGSPAGSCVWHVLGWEKSLKDWALEQGWNGRRILPEHAAGILIAALGTLETHFGTAVTMGAGESRWNKSSTNH
jgi:hypothetical protein